MMKTNNEARFWILEPEKVIPEMENFFGIRRGQRSRYLQRKDFLPDTLSHMQPKQLVDTATHSGFIPIRMGEDGKRLIARDVEKMLGGVAWRFMHQAVEHLGQVAPDAYKTLHAVMARLPLVTNEMIAERLGYRDVSTVYDHLNKAMGVVYDYLRCVADGWPVESGA